MKIICGLSNDFQYISVVIPKIVWICSNIRSWALSIMWFQVPQHWHWFWSPVNVAVHLKSIKWLITDHGIHYHLDNCNLSPGREIFYFSVLANYLLMQSMQMQAYTLISTHYTYVDMHNYTIPKCKCKCTMHMYYCELWP